MADEKVIIYAMGDRQIQQGMKDEIFKRQFDPIVPVIRDGDIRYCQLECMFSDHPAPISGAPVFLCMSPDLISRLNYLGIDITSPNGNHNMEFGPGAMIDCLEELEKHGIKSVGGGRNIQEARKPVIFDEKGTKIAFLAYNSVFRPGEEAGPNRPGIAPIQIDTFYQQIEMNQPGTPARIRTFANQEDLQAMQEDIRKAKKLADVVIICYHAGIHFIRAKMADYEFEVCHAAVDAGADLILGSHPHVLKAVEVYKEKVIFHSLANFGFDMPHDTQTGALRPPALSPRVKEQIERYGVQIDNLEKADEIFGAWSEEAMQTGIAKIIISNKKIQKVSFLPVLFDRAEGPAKVLHAGSKGFNQVAKYIKDISQEAGVSTEFRVEGDELVIVNSK